MQSAFHNQHVIRAFATEEPDLEIDFVTMTQPQLVTGVIKACLHCSDQSICERDIWSWSLKERLQALLMITMHSYGSELLLQVPCSNSSCGENIELPLDLKRFAQASDDNQVSLEIDDQQIMLRLPNGSDQLQWVQMPELSPGAIASRLVVSIDGQQPDHDWQMPSHWIDQLGQSLEQKDELMTLQIQSQCPACDHSFDCDLDLEAQLLSGLARTQQTLLRNIHLIASVYHWSEAEIMKLTPSRRQTYLAYIRAHGNGETLQ